MSEREPTVRELEILIGELEKRIWQQFQAQSEAVRAALAASKEAVVKAEHSAEKRAEAQNEWRGAMNDRERMLMPRTESVQRHEAMAQKVEGVEKAFSERMIAMERRLTLMEGRGAGLSQGWGYLVGAVGLLLTLIGIFTYLAK